MDELWCVYRYASGKYCQILERFKDGELQTNKINNAMSDWLYCEDGESGHRFFVRPSELEKIGCGE